MSRATEPLTVAGPRRIHTGFQLHGPFTHFNCEIRVAWRVGVWQPPSILLELDDPSFAHGLRDRASRSVTRMRCSTLAPFPDSNSTTRSPSGKTSNDWP